MHYLRSPVGNMGVDLQPTYIKLAYMPPIIFLVVLHLFHILYAFYLLSSISSISASISRHIRSSYLDMQLPVTNMEAKNVIAIPMNRPEPKASNNVIYFIPPQ